MQVRGVCRLVSTGDDLPLAPQLFLSQFLDEATERQRAMTCCLKLVSLVDEMRVFAERSEGMRLEITEARRLGIPVVEVTE